MDPTKNQRPGGDSEALKVALNHDSTLSERTDETADLDVVVRCRRCRRPLAAPESIEREAGPVCCRRAEGVA